jgi:hypothetical protein
MVCLRNISVDTLHKGDTEGDDDDDNNNNNNNISIILVVVRPNEGEGSNVRYHITSNFTAYTSTAWLVKSTRIEWDANVNVLG